MRDGFRGPIHCTSATADLLGVMLPDAGHIQEKEAEWQTRKRQRGGKREVPPLYTEADAMAVLPALRPVPYGESIVPGPGVSAAFLDAGHILGSAIVTVTVVDEGTERSWSSPATSATGGCRSFATPPPSRGPTPSSSNRRTATGSTRGWRRRWRSSPTP